MNTKIKYNKKNQLADLILLLFPNIIIFGAICAVCVWVFTTFISSNSMFNFVVVPNPDAIPIETELKDPEVVTSPDTESDSFPVIPYESQWATLNVENWNYRDIPVYFGDSNQILSYGAGMWIGSRFCGQGGKTVLSAHVTSHFYEIEDTPVGAVLTMDTIYGTYKYRVTDVVIFNYTDDSYLLADDKKDSLIIYTCYPRINGFDFKTERIALICEKISGKDWKQ